MNTKLFKIGQKVYIKPNAREIIHKLDAIEGAKGHGTVGWDEGMDRLVGKFCNLGYILKPDDDRPRFRAIIAGYHFYLDCLDCNILPEANI